MASAPQTIALRFQRQELQQQADLSPPALAALACAAGPRELIAALDQERDAAAALALMLPRRQAVWWACLSARLVPATALCAAEAAALDAAEAWVQTQSAEESDRAAALAEPCDAAAPARWAALAAHWSGPSIAPRGQAAVAPAGHLAGVATRAALTLTIVHPAMRGRLGYGDLLAIGIDLMHGDLGRRRQAALRERLAAEAG